MIEVRLHRFLYLATAVDEAAEVYGPYAALERVDVDDYWAVRVTGASPERERQIAGELANYALGVTVGVGSGQKPGGAAS